MEKFESRVNVMHTTRQAMTILEWIPVW
jgi:hypothetical protein